MLAGKLAAEVVTDKAVYGGPTKGVKKIVEDVVKARAVQVFLFIFFRPMA